MHCRAWVRGHHRRQEVSPLLHLEWVALRRPHLSVPFPWYEDAYIDRCMCMYKTHTGKFICVFPGSACTRLETRLPYWKTCLKTFTCVPQSLVLRATILDFAWCLLVKTYLYIHWHMPARMNSCDAQSIQVCVMNSCVCHACKCVWCIHVYGMHSCVYDVCKCVSSMHVLCNPPATLLACLKYSCAMHVWYGWSCVSLYMV